MKPRTFTYNQIIDFFVENNLPLNEKQVFLIGTKVKEEMIILEMYQKQKQLMKDREYIRKRGKKNKKNPVDNSVD